MIKLVNLNKSSIYSLINLRVIMLLSILSTNKVIINSCAIVGSQALHKWQKVQLLSPIKLARSFFLMLVLNVDDEV